MIPYLYTIADHDRLHEMIHAFHHCTNLPIQILDEKGSFLDTSCSRCHYCELFEKNTQKKYSCETVHLNAAKYATSLGETYTFTCPANLSHIVFPLMNQTALFGSVLVGPFLMEAPDAVMMSDLSRRFRVFLPMSCLSCMMRQKKYHAQRPRQPDRSANC